MLRLLNVECWMLDIEYRTLDVECWCLEGRLCLLLVGCAGDFLVVVDCGRRQITMCSQRKSNRTKQEAFPERMKKKPSVRPSPAIWAALMNYWYVRYTVSSSPRHHDNSNGRSSEIIRNKIKYVYSRTKHCYYHTMYSTPCRPSACCSFTIFCFLRAFLHSSIFYFLFNVYLAVHWQTHRIYAQTIALAGCENSKMHRLNWVANYLLQEG